MQSAPTLMPMRLNISMLNPFYLLYYVREREGEKGRDVLYQEIEWPNV